MMGAASYTQCTYRCAWRVGEAFKRGCCYGALTCVQMLLCMPMQVMTGICNIMLAVDAAQAI
jgi:hypothetical protein